MSDTYQAVYDAARSRIHGANIGEAIEAALRDAFGNAYHLMVGVAQDYSVAAFEQQRPSVLYRPRIAIDGNMWGAVYGDNIQQGVAGFGESPALAMADFDKNWNATLPENDTEQGYYEKIETPREALYEAACALDNQDVPLEDWPVKLIAALARAGFAVVPVELPPDALGRAAIAGVAETGNPKHAWDFLIAATRAA